MTGNIRLIVGLGNPGSEYEHTRHNTGADFVQKLADRLNVSLRESGKYYGLYGKLSSGQTDIHFLLPTTFMNLSGKAVGALAPFFKISPEEILVVQDELDLPPGRMKLKIGGGHGGHNGIKDIVRSLGNNGNFYRLRIGIGHPADRSQVVGFVLNRAPASERDMIEEAMLGALPVIEKINNAGIDRTINSINGFTCSKNKE